MLAQIIVWAAAVYIVLLTILSVLYLIAMTLDSYPKPLIAAFVGMVICLAIISQTFIISIPGMHNPIVRGISVACVVWIIFLWTCWVFSVFSNN